MTRSQATPVSSQVLWLEQRVEKLEDLAEERLQNCAALVAENERLRSELARPESTDMTLMRTLAQSQATELEQLRKDAERKPMDKEHQDVIVDAAQASPWTFRRSARWVIEATERHHGIKRTP